MMVGLSRTGVLGGRLVSAALVVPIALLVMLSVPGALSAAPASTEGVKTAIQAAYDDQDVALVARDLDRVMVPYAEDAIFINDIPGAKGQGLEHQGLAGARQGWVDLFNLPNKATAASHEIKEITVSKTGGGATILTLHHITLSGTTKAGRPFETRIDEILRHFWAKTGDGWRIKQERLLSVDTFRNGKLVRHNRRPVTP